MKKCNIYVVTHKIMELPEKLTNKGFSLISVGSACEKNKQGFSDNVGDNISYKNANYCELTALYWIWKNDDESKYKGLCHYRRFFAKGYFSHDIGNYMVDTDFINIFNDGIDIILPEKQYFVRSAEENYLRCGYKKDLDITRNVLLEKYPEYLKEYDNVMNGNKSYLTNMFVAKKEIFDQYCNWLFDILFEVERRTDISSYSIQEARIFGYISERLLTVWIWHNNYNCIEKHTINIEDSVNVSYVIKQFFIKIKMYQFSKTVIWKMKQLVNRSSKNDKDT